MTDLTQVPFEELAAEYGRRTAAMRKSFGGGRSAVLRKCPKGCGAIFGAREMRKHTTGCTGKPARKRTRKVATR